MIFYEDEFKMKNVEVPKWGDRVLTSLRGKYDILAGKLTSDGEVENNAPASKYIALPDYTLTAVTNAQEIYNFENLRYKRLMLSMRAQAATISYDWRLMFYRPEQGIAYRMMLGNETTPSNRWFDDAQASATPRLYDGLVPYGKGVRMTLRFDNNHATDAIVVEVALLFYDPVR